MSDEPRACSECGAAEAVVHLTQIVDDVASVLHLCEKCAAARGISQPSPPENSPLADFLSQMTGAEEGAAEGEENTTCSFCSLTFAGFRESGRLGCPHCYTTFEFYLKNLLRRVHGGVQHVGKVYLPPDPTASERERRLEGLRRKLKYAISTEDFERAAKLRDQIRSLEPATR